MNSLMKFKHGLVWDSLSNCNRALPLASFRTCTDCCAVGDHIGQHQAILAEVGKCQQFIPEWHHIEKRRTKMGHTDTHSIYKTTVPLVCQRTFMSPSRRSAWCHSPAFSNALLTQLKLTTVGLSLALRILFCKILPILIHSTGIKHAWFQLVLVGLACFQQSKSTDSMSRWKKHNGIAAQTDANRTFNPEKGKVSCSLNKYALRSHKPSNVHAKSLLIARIFGVLHAMWLLLHQSCVCGFNFYCPLPLADSLASI